MFVKMTAMTGEVVYVRARAIVAIQQIAPKKSQRKSDVVYTAGREALEITVKESAEDIADAAKGVRIGPHSHRE